MKIKAKEWMNEEGELNIISKTQKELAQSPKSQQIFSQYSFFKQNGLTVNAQEIRKNVNHAMDLAYERDTGWGPSERFDVPSNLGF